MYRSSNYCDTKRKLITIACKSNQERQISPLQVSDNYKERKLKKGNEEAKNRYRKLCKEDLCIEIT
jgi:hypothetical protein